MIGYVQGYGDCMMSSRGVSGIGLGTPPLTPEARALEASISGWIGLGYLIGGGLLLVFALALGMKGRGGGTA